MKWLLGILINAVLFVAISGYFSGLYIDSFLSAVIASVVLSVLNILVRPLLIIFTLPITFVTLGFFLFVINAVTLLLTDGIMGSAFEISGFGMALFIAVIMAIVNLVLQMTVFQKHSA
ncbi:putative membrane protein [Bacillus ectoiniformans]|uniref:phage holin family protein n=1 Tax=Bacillus ectoiniformans TaxID=1494429 RepID=UPI00195E3FEB|nr:phage holin family protein [Bacillus ectoiniformans]MBM7648767.1 putative membrane protein [Bacillus ectoiniformans]